MAKRPIKADMRKTVSALVTSAASGRRDLAWLAAAIRRAGYVPAADALTQSDVKRSVRAIAQALADAQRTAESPCCRACLEHAIDILSALAAGK